MKEFEYETVDSEDQRHLVARVNDRAKDGWECIGFTSYETRGSNGCTHFCAMLKRPVSRST